MLGERGLFGTFDYDNWLASHDDHQEAFREDEDNWVFRGGQWIYIGDV